MFMMAPHTRIRPTPFFEATVEDGVTTFSSYNQMMMPLGYGDPDAEYWRLINGVSQWDVACQRQVQLRGPDAARLAQILSPRRLDRCRIGQGKYVPLCNHAGTVINDPILLKIDDDCFWLSIADSNIIFWSRAIAAERGLNVDISEAPVSPMALQGPKAEDVVAHLFGDWTRDIKFFWFKHVTLEGIPLQLARSGWSKQGGFEFYLMEENNGKRLWQIVREAGKAWDIGPGYPNACERIESGLLSWGGDTDDRTNPFEIRLGSYVDLDVNDDVIGIKELRKVHTAGAARHQLGLILDDDQPMSVHGEWYAIHSENEQVGHMTNGVWSRRLERNIGYALISSDYHPGDRVHVEKKREMIPASLVNLPFT